MKDPFSILQEKYSSARSKGHDPVEAEVVAKKDTYHYLLQQLYEDERVEAVVASFRSLEHDRNVIPYLELNFRVKQDEDRLEEVHIS